MQRHYNIVHELQNYMLFNVLKKEKENEKPKEIPPVETKKKKEEVINKPPSVDYQFFFPRRSNDALFWCFYVMKNGMTAYEMDPPSFEKEKVEKIKYITQLRNNKSILKEHRIQKLCDIESNLSLDKNIQITTFFALCALEKINATVIKKQVYSNIISDTSSNKTFILYDLGKGSFKLDYDQYAMDNLTYEQTHFKLPLKAISGYKLGEVQDICKKLKIIIPVECKKKQDIYTLIKECINKID